MRKHPYERDRIARERILETEKQILQDTLFTTRVQAETWIFVVVFLLTLVLMKVLFR